MPKTFSQWVWFSLGLTTLPFFLLAIVSYIRAGNYSANFAYDIGRLTGEQIVLPILLWGVVITPIVLWRYWRRRKEA